MEEDVGKAVGNKVTIEIILGAIGLIIAAVFTLLKTIPKKYFETRRRRRARNKHLLEIDFHLAVADFQLTSIDFGSESQVIIGDLKTNIGAMFVHVIRYYYEFNDDEITLEEMGELPDPEKHKMKMKIVWEDLGTGQCALCKSQCAAYGKRRRVQNEWDGLLVQGAWRDVMTYSMDHRDQVGTWDKENMDDVGREIWQRMGVERYKETYICKHAKGFFCLGVSLCRRMKNMPMIDGIMLKGSERLKNIFMADQKYYLDRLMQCYDAH